MSAKELHFNTEARAALKRGMLMDDILNLKAIDEVARMKETPNDQWKAWFEPWLGALPDAFGAQAAVGGA